MSRLEAGPSPADAQPSRARDSSSRSANVDRASENRVRAQQNRERAAASRNHRVASATDADAARSASRSKPSVASGGAPQQVKKPANKEEARAAPNRQAKASTQFKSKVVIRRLPPNLPEEVFWNAVSPWVRDAADCQALNAHPPPPNTSIAPDSEASSSAPSASTGSATSPATPTVDFKRFVAGKLKADANKQSKHARGYVRFLDAAALVQFHKHFDGHIFRDSKARETVAIVEFAPYQKVILASSATTRGRRNKPDAKQGTIETDADFLGFVERLSGAGEHAKRSEGDLLASLHDPREREKQRDRAAAAGKSTPLLQHLRALKQAKLESAALAKKAKKADKAAAKVAAKNAAKALASTAPADASKTKAKRGKKEGAKDKAVAVDAGAAERARTGKREKKTKPRKGKGRAEGNADDATHADPSPKPAKAEAGAKKAGSATKGLATATPATSVPALKNSAAKPAGGRPAKNKAEGKGRPEVAGDTAPAERDGSGRSKKTPRRKAPAKDTAGAAKPPASGSSAPTAPQPKMQILKRET